MFFKGKRVKKYIAFQLILLLLLTLFQPVFIKSYAEDSGSTTVDFDFAGLETTRITGGVEPDDYSYYPSVSGDGRYIAFESNASNLLAGDDNESTDVFVYDRETDEIEMVGYDEDGEQLGISYHADITSDGRYVVFVSNYLGESYIFVRDRQLRITQSLGIWCDDRPFISNTGQYITYRRGTRIYGNDRTTGTEFLIGNGQNPSISGDGRYIAYNYNDGSWKINVHDIQSGISTRIDKNSFGEYSNSGNYYPKISGDGRFVSFMSSDSNLTDDIGVYGEDIYVHDRDIDGNGIYDEPGNTNTILASKSSSGVPANSRSGEFGEGSAISDSGRYVAFLSYADNLVPGDTNENQDLFVHDIVEGKTVRVNVSSNGDQIGEWDDIYYPAISGDGLTTAYVCDSPNLVSNDTNGDLDVFISKIYEKGSPEVVLESNQELTESNLDQSTVTLKIKNDTFSTSSLTEDDFQLNNVQGLTIGDVNFIDETSCTILLEFDGTDFDENINNFNITILGTVLNSGEEITSNDLLIIGEIEPGVIQFSSDYYTVMENEGAVVLTVTRTGGSDGWVGLEYSTLSEGDEGEATATPGEDYESAMWESLEFEDGDTSEDITIPIINNDDQEEENEFFYVRLYSGEGGGGELGSPIKVTVTIIEDGAKGITNTSPSNNATGISIDTDVNISFSEDIKAKDIDLISFKDADNSVVDYVYNINNNELLLNPINNLDYLTTYTITIPSGTVTDAVYNEFQDDYTFSFTTEPNDTVFIDNQAPTWSEGAQITASNLGRSNLTLNWSEANDNVGVTNYRVYKNEQLLTTVPGSQKNYNVSGLSSSTTYTFKVEAGDEAQNWSSDGPTCAVTTLEPPSSSGGGGGGSLPRDLKPPVWPEKTVFITDTIKQDSLTLKWTEATDNVRVANYIIYIDGKYLDSVSGNTLKYKVEKLQFNEEYAFEIEARDESGNTSKDNPSLKVKTKGSIDKLLVKPQAVIGGMMDSSGVISLIDNLDNDHKLSIELSTNNGEVIEVPKEIVIDPKENSGSFEIKTYEVEEITDVVITAKLNDEEINAVLKVLPDYEYNLHDLGKIDKYGEEDVFAFDSEGELTDVLWQYPTTTTTPHNSSFLPEGAMVLATNRKDVFVGKLQTQINFTGTHPGTGDSLTNETIDVQRGFRYSSSYGVQQIGTLGGLNSSATDINDDGYITGWSQTLHDTKHGFIAEPGTGVINLDARNWVEINNLNMIDLGTLGGRSSEALGINNLGHVVGISDTSQYSEVSEVVKEYTRHGFVYNSVKGMRDLNYLINPLLKWEIEKAYDINDKGQILAVGTVNGEKQACLLTPRNPSNIYNENHELGDIKPTDWFYSDVMTLSSKGIISGYDDGTFKPDKEVNADEFITMVVKALGYINMKEDMNYWAQPFIKKAEDIGLIESGEFSGYNQVLTREEMTRIIVRSINESFPEDLSKYKDSIKDFDSIDSKFQDYVLKAYAKGIISGYTDGEFKPKNTTTRAQAATVITRILDSSQRITY